ncbi:hypothetical protein D3C87_1823260 [compost metagenome]
MSMERSFSTQSSPAQGRSVTLSGKFGAPAKLCDLANNLLTARFARQPKTGVERSGESGNAGKWDFRRVIHSRNRIIDSASAGLTFR